MRVLSEELMGGELWMAEMRTATPRIICLHRCRGAWAERPY